MGEQFNSANGKATDFVSGGLRLRVVLPPPDIAPYISTYYRTEVSGEPVNDWLPPESANLRVGRAKVYEAAIGGDQARKVPLSIISGPTSRATLLRIDDGRFWGIGLLPLGFAKIIGLPASDFADRFSDVANYPALNTLRPMLEHLAASTGDIDRDVTVINDCLRPLLAKPLAKADEILATHSAIASGDRHSVASLARGIGASTRTLERHCYRYFGFGPQLLLRRQRFLRSLAKFMLDPSMKWIQSLDTQYHDQAHFVRDFKRFMGTKPSEFARANHPIAMAAVRARSAAGGEALQALHNPTGVRSGESGL